MRHPVAMEREAAPSLGGEPATAPEPREAIVVLGCRVLSSGRLSAEAMARTTTAAAAYLAGQGHVVVASGGRRWGAFVEATRMKAALVEAGVPAEAIVAELCSLSTFENAVFSVAVLTRLGVDRARVVTSDWHMQRALENFRALGVDALPLSSRGSELPFSARAKRFVEERLSARLDRARHRQRAFLCESAARLATTGAPR